MSIDIGDRVVIEQDETRYRSKGTGPQFGGRTGTVIQVRRVRSRVRQVTPRTDDRGALQIEGPVMWFQDYELRPCGEASP
jgi:ribosomal protein L21E